MEQQDGLGNSLVSSVPEERVDIVLIDDDPIFCSLMEEHARRMSINLHFFHDLLEVQNSGALQKYQVAILDYQLEQMNGLEVANWIPSFFNDMPIVLVSYEDRNQENTASAWPGSVRCFVHKREGVKSILAHALAVRDQLKQEENYKRRQEEERMYGPGPYRWLLGDHSIKQKVEENMHSLERMISRNVHKMVDRFVRHKDYDNLSGFESGMEPEQGSDASPSTEKGTPIMTTANQLGLQSGGSLDQMTMKVMNQL